MWIACATSLGCYPAVAGEIVGVSKYDPGVTVWLHPLAFEKELNKVQVGWSAQQLKQALGPPRPDEQPADPDVWVYEAGSPEGPNVSYRFKPRRIQLDYDCPVQRLEAWARVLRQRPAPGGALERWEVWITSLPSQVQTPGFGPRLRGVVAGHILQVFDNGDAYSPASEARMADALRRAQGGVARTGHGAWVTALRRLSTLPNFRGTWVFAAAQHWTSLATELP